MGFQVTTKMINLGSIEFRGKLLALQVEGRQIYVGGAPVEQWPKDLRAEARDRAALYSPTHGPGEK